MSEIIVLCVVVVFTLYQAWIYSRMDIELDFAVWALWGVTGAKYGKDFIDCKSPGVHLWYLLLSKIKKYHQVMRLVHYTVLTLLGLIYFLITKNAGNTIAFIVLVHSAWIYAFNGNVGDIPAGLILIALVIGNPWLAVLLLGIAAFYEPKLLPSVAAIVILNFSTMWLPATIGVVLALLAAAYIWYFHHPTWDNLVYSNITLGARMTKYRKGLYPWMPNFTARTFLYLAPWFAAAIYARPDWKYWLPCVLYIVFIAFGKVIRTQHMMPVVAWIAGAGIMPELVYALVFVDWFTAGFYIGNIWHRFYPEMEVRIGDAKKVGLYVKDKPGVLWVNSSNPEIYIWAKKKPPYGFLELVEINDVSVERRKVMNERITHNPPDLIVQPTFGAATDYNLAKYKAIGNTNMFVVYQRKVK
jgi:hypothetical protein